MSRSERGAGSATDNGSHAGVGRLSVVLAPAPDPDYIDDALDGLVETVDDLVRDLAVEDGTSPFPYAVAGEREPDRLRLLAAAWQPVANGATSRIVRVRGRVFTVAVVLIFATCVFLLLAWLFSKQ